MRYTVALLRSPGNHSTVPHRGKHARVPLNFSYVWDIWPVSVNLISVLQNLACFVNLTSVLQNLTNVF